MGWCDGIASTSISHLKSAWFGLESQIEVIHVLSYHNATNLEMYVVYIWWDDICMGYISIYIYVYIHTWFDVHDLMGHYPRYIEIIMISWDTYPWDTYTWYIWHIIHDLMGWFDGIFIHVKYEYHHDYHGITWWDIYPYYIIDMYHDIIILIWWIII